ncbi:sensor histidine kinase [Clostridium sp. NSJ-6]|uniref:histidine kinase n=1 Tax=Clostridium hominis TaxID=2763036 RepID=A0ABR7DD50_9CLOT|nr:sensor histidine kinase [Clostridium hominis]MBC5629321.1 sensor histidine kinase [Clostridium hominis]MDU2670916.1 sensor histidine kinase [Clostridium sp.]
MRLGKYLIDKLPFLILNIIIFTFCAIIMTISNLTIQVVIVLALIWFVPIFIFIIIDFISKRKFYNELIQISNKLDKKYLLPEVIKKPRSYEGQILYDVLEESNRAMHEHVNEYKIMQSEYREYIEAWVHEIKTPIALTKLVAENSEGKTKTIIQNQSKKIEEYVEQVLYYSRSTDVSKDYIVKEFDINETVKKVIRNNRYDLITGKFQIDISESECTVISDEKWVEFIINQVIVNSIKYKKDINPKIKAYTKRFDDKVILTIEDNGIGIINKDIAKVFDKGFTGYNGRRFGKSTGIGLYLCKKLCLKLGLNITLTSEYENGTKVNIIFPLGNLTILKES